MELAEACLRTGGELIAAMRTARHPGYGLFGKREPGDTAVQEIARERLKQAWEAWREFTQQYTLATFYFDVPQPNWADELTEALSDLSGRLTEPLREVRREFFFHPGDEPDDIERKIQAAETQLRAFFGPILRIDNT